MNDHISHDTVYFKHSRPEIQRIVPDAAKTLLDIGCGEGIFGKGLKINRNIEVWGVEIDSEAAKNARNNLDNVINLPFSSSIECPDHYFDVITFNDSLEHFPDPVIPLELSKRFLKPDEYIIVSLPNVRYINNLRNLLIGKDWKYETEGILDNTHLKFFTLKSMNRLFHDLNFTVIDQFGINEISSIGWKLKILNFIFKKHLDDTKYLQYVSILKEHLR